MGEEGARSTADGAARAAALVEDWAVLGPVSSKKMFGGHGLFHDGVMFAIVDPAGDLYLKADEGLQHDLEAQGSTRHGQMPYWSVPDAVADDEVVLRRLASRAVLVAHEH